MTKYDSRYDIARRLTTGPTQALVVTGVSVAVQLIDGAKGTVDTGRLVNNELAKVKHQKALDRSASRAARKASRDDAVSKQKEKDQARANAKKA